MDSYSARGQHHFLYFRDCLGTMAVLNHLTTFLPQFKTSETASVSLNKVHDMTVNTYLGMDQAMLSFDIDHDLSSDFHWNMNQLFVYLVASYNDTSNKRNEVTVWDRIVQSEKQAKLSSKDLMVEYPLRDMYRELKGKDARLHLRYRTMPIVGLMQLKDKDARLHLRYR